RALLVPDAGRAIRLPRHPQRVDLDCGLFHRARRRKGDLPPDLPLRLPPRQRRGAVAARDVRGHGPDAAEVAHPGRERDRGRHRRIGRAGLWPRQERLLVRLAALHRGDEGDRAVPERDGHAGVVRRARRHGVGAGEPDRRHRRGRRDGFPPLPRNPDALSGPREGVLYRLDAALGSPRPVSGGYRYERSLAVQERAGALSSSPEPAHSASYGAAPATVLTNRLAADRQMPADGAGLVDYKAIWEDSMNHLACLAGGMSLLIASAALAADTGQLPCKTTQECNENAAKIGANVPSGAQLHISQPDAAEDQFYWVNKINKASTVMLVEEGIFPKGVGQLIAKGVDYAIRQAQRPGGKRPGDVLQIEKIMTDKVGEEASVIHAGRSRQDMYATYRAAKLRNQTLDFAEALLGLRARMLAKAADNLDALMPAYTNGVQAVPVTYGHYLLAYEESFERDQQRIREAYRRLNLSPMGVGVMSNSIWPLNRVRLAQ